MRKLPYLFLGPTEKYFDKKAGSKVKKLVKALFDYEYFMNPDLGKNSLEQLDVRVKPNTGYATAVATAILEYREQNPNATLTSVRSRVSSFSLKYVTDGRYKNEGYYDESDSYHRRYLSDDYKQGFFSMVNNLFDYAYQQGYIHYQPFLLVDISKQ